MLNIQFENFKKMVCHPHIRIYYPSRTIYYSARVIAYPFCTDKQLEAEFWLIYENFPGYIKHAMDLLRKHRPKLAKKFSSEMQEKVLIALF